VRLERQFDAVVALFHVMSYQLLEPGVAAVLDTAAFRMAGELFLFDVWHGPAVFVSEATRPRENLLPMAASALFATLVPELRVHDKVVVVNYDFTCFDSESGDQLNFSNNI
jgi:hypothetical protein